VCVGVSVGLIKTEGNLYSSINSIVSSNCASVSVGNPQIMSVCVCVYVCMRESGREIESVCVCVNACVSECECVWV